MKVDVETVSSVQRRVAVEIPETEVAAELGRAYEELRKTARIPGFRPGRAPRSVLERMFGDKLRAEVIERLIQGSIVEALQEKHIAPVGEPRIVTEETAAGGPLRYSAFVEVIPEVVASGYSGIEVDRPLLRVEESHIDHYLRRLQESLAQLHPIADRSVARRGDLASVDFEVRVGGRVVQSVRDRLVEVVEPSAPESIGAHLEGAEIGQLVSFDVNFPADHPDERVAGKVVHFEVTIKSLARKDLPALDDEFAKDHGECATLEALRQKVRERLEESARQQGERAVRAGVLKALVASHEVEVPKAMVERRTEVLVDEFIGRMGAGRPPLSREGQLRERLRSELRDQARDEVKAGLLLEAIARQEGIEVSESEIDAYVESAASQVDVGAREYIHALYKDAGRRASLRGQILQERALDWVVRRAHVRDVNLHDEVAEGVGTG